MPSETETEDLFEMANLFPATTGLPMTLWVSPRGNARHDVRVKGPYDAREPDERGKYRGGRRSPAPRIIAGHLAADDERAVFRWVSLNEPALIALLGTARSIPFS